METRSNLTKMLEGNQGAIATLEKEKEYVAGKIQGVDVENSKLESQIRGLTTKRQNELAYDEIKKAATIKKEIDSLKSQFQSDYLIGLQRRNKTIETKLQGLDSERREIEKNLLDLDDTEALAAVEKELDILIPL